MKTLSNEQIEIVSGGEICSCSKNGYGQNDFFSTPSCEAACCSNAGNIRGIIYCICNNYHMDRSAKFHCSANENLQCNPCPTMRQIANKNSTVGPLNAGYVGFVYTEQ